MHETKTKKSCFGINEGKQGFLIEQLNKKYNLLPFGYRSEGRSIGSTSNSEAERMYFKKDGILYLNIFLVILGSTTS